jgi:hypothetical protein
MAHYRGSPASGSSAHAASPFLTEANPALGLRLPMPKQRVADDPVPPAIAAPLIRDELLLGGREG